MDCIKWAQLPPIHPVLQKSCSLVRGRFTGSPSYETTVQETGPSTEEERPELPEEVRVRETSEKNGRAIRYDSQGGSVGHISVAAVK